MVRGEEDTEQISKNKQEAIAIDTAGDILVTGDATIGAVTGGTAIVTEGIVKVTNGTFTVNGDIYANGTESVGAYAYGSSALIIVNGDITVDGYNSRGALAEHSGTVNVTGDITVDGDDSYGALADNSSIIVNGDITTTGDNSTGAFAEASGSIMVTGNVTGGASGVYAENGAKITVTGDVKGTSSSGAYAEGASSEITIVGNITDGVCGAEAADNAKITVAGNVKGSAFGVHADIGAQATVNGTITAPMYIDINGTAKTINDKDATSSKTGYFQYSGGTPISYVWVKDPSYRPPNPSPNPTPSTTRRSSGGGSRGGGTVTIGDVPVPLASSPAQWLEQNPADTAAGEAKDQKQGYVRTNQTALTVSGATPGQNSRA